MTIEAYAVQHRQVVLLAEREIVDAVRGRRVYDAGAVLDTDEIRSQHPECVFRIHLEVIEQLLISHTDEFATLHGLRHCVLDISEYGLSQCFGNDQRLSIRFAIAVIDVLAHSECEIRRQCPWRCRPDEKVGVVLTLQLEAHRDRRVVGFLVAERQLVRRQRRTDTWIVRHNLVAAIDEPLVIDDLEEIPDGLDIGVIERVIRFVQVHPEAHTFRHLLPVADVAHDGFTTATRELGDADLLLDFFLIEDAELFFDFVLDRQAVRIPAGLARCVVPTHGLVTREDVLERTREDVVNAGLSVCSRRAFVETEARTVFRHRERLLEGLVLTPERKHFFFEGRPVVSS